MQADAIRTATLEAFADTVVPGEKRGDDDVSVAGAAAGGGAVAAGALELLATDGAGMEPILDGLVAALNDHATEWAARRGLALDRDLPAFVALPFGERTGLVSELVGPGHAEKELWVSLALFSNMAYDSAAHLSTVEALAAGHPGLRAMGIDPPDPDGLWRFPDFSYRRPLARLHPGTTASGSPA
ncbi:DUF5987 family protein [Actinoplanes siamensis]|uniref:Uncharacterized protein n=1 Tax=Actinoplanes siamensis TaxID=1223317 RepID=A0A919TLC0_9ACTN|nr:DUF5987 family protein [Actinoplanes siamensis]GIF07011.1 hypothetical protein Asi03nite_45490 [Actinoplanes siamensis]